MEQQVNEEKRNLHGGTYNVQENCAPSTKWGDHVQFPCQSSNMTKKHQLNGFSEVADDHGQSTITMSDTPTWGKICFVNCLADSFEQIKIF